MAACNNNEILPVDPTKEPYFQERVCSPYTLADGLDNSANVQYAEEALNIAGAPVNIFRLQGIHECTKLVDQVGFGKALSSGEYPVFPASNAFDVLLTEWRSTQKGTCITSLPAYIGYDFGVIKLPNGRIRYGIDAAVRKHITSIILKQGCTQHNRISKARVERSDDGIKWYGVAIIDIADNEDEQLITFRQSAPSRMWRLSALTFNGTSADFWAVVSLQMLDHHAVRLTNIQDENGFLENRDRQYATESIQLKAYYQLQDIQAELTRFGHGLQDQLQHVFRFGFQSTITNLGRPLVVGDILEVPSEAQYTPELKLVKRYLEVTDVTWAIDGYTPGWRPTLLRVVAQPAFASQETRDIFGSLEMPSTDNDFNNLDQQQYNLEALILDAKVLASGKTQTPEDGEDDQGIRKFTQAELDGTEVPLGKLQYTGPRSKYTEDGLPPNSESYTEGPTRPSSPVNGAYHRQTYPGLPDEIPPRLFRWSDAKNQWLFVEEDKRFRHRVLKPTLQSYLEDPTAVPPDQLDK